MSIELEIKYCYNLCLSMIVSSDDGECIESDLKEYVKCLIW